jgi:DNA-binding transcriptional regulator YiaG
LVNSTEIRVYMARRGNMSVSQLAYLLGKSPATVGRWLERGDLPVTYAERIIELLQIPLGEACQIFFGVVVAEYATNGVKRNTE